MQLLLIVTVEEFIQHPLFLLAAGAVITGVFIPWFTKRWQDNKTKTEIRVSLTQEMSELTASAMGKIYTAIATDKHTFSERDTVELYKEFEIWNTRSYSLAAKLRAYFPYSSIHKKWMDYSSLVIRMWELARILNIDTNERTTKIMEIVERKWKKLIEESKWNELTSINWTKIKNGDISELNKLSAQIMRYGYDHLMDGIFDARMRKI